MRNVVLSIFSAFLLLSGFSASAQFVTATGKDSAIGYYSGTGTLEVHNDIKATGSSVTIRWNVEDSYFGTGWEMIGSGFCDNVLCYNADLTNNIFLDHTVQTSDAYGPGGGDFKMVFNIPTAPPNGSSAWVRIKAQESGGLYNKQLTFIGYKNATGVTTTINSSDDVVLYPNPAKEAVNVIFDNKAGIKTIAIYNLIGKMVSPVYRPSSNSSAKIDVNELPSGVYFIRLMDGQGHVVATRRFVHQ